MQDIQMCIEITGNKHYTLPMLTDVPRRSTTTTCAWHSSSPSTARSCCRRSSTATATLGNDHPIAPANRYSTRSCRSATYDPDKAKFHLKKAGLEVSVELHAADAAFEGAVDAAVLYKENAPTAGIEHRGRCASRTTATGRTSGSRSRGARATGAAGRPRTGCSPSLRLGRDWNDTHWENERFNKLLVEARGELDEAKRARDCTSRCSGSCVTMAAR